MNRYKGILCAVLSSIAFGLLPIFAKLAYAKGSNATTVLIFRFGIAALLLFVYLKFKKVSLSVSKKQFLLLLFIGILGYTVTTQTLFMSYDYLGAGLSTTLHFVYPCVVCILSFLIFKDKMSKSKLISLILSGLGVYTLVSLKSQTLHITGITLALFSGITYGMTIAALSLKEIKNLDHEVTTFYVCLGATLGMIIYGLCTNSIALTFNAPIIFSYMSISIISTIVSMILMLKAISIIGPASTSILGTFEPIVSIVFGILLFKESLSFSLLIGSFLILSATIILAKDKERVIS